MNHLKSILYIKKPKCSFKKKRLEAGKLVLDLENEDKSLSAGEIKGKLRHTKATTQTLFSFFDQVVAKLKKSGQIKTAEVYKDTKRNLEQFTSEYDKQFSEIDVSFLTAWE